MSRAPSTFRESDVKRAVKALEAAGKKVTSVEIEDGRIRIKLKNGNDAEITANDNTDGNPWDQVDK